MTGAEGGRSPAGRCRGRLEGAIAALREHTLNWPESPPGAPVSSARDVCKRWEQWLERRERLLNVLAECPWDGPEGKGDSILDAFHALLEAEERARRALVAQLTLLRRELFRRTRAARARAGYLGPGRPRRTSASRARSAQGRVNRKG